MTPDPSLLSPYYHPHCWGNIYLIEYCHLHTAIDEICHYFWKLWAWSWSGSEPGSKTFCRFGTKVSDLQQCHLGSQWTDVAVWKATFFFLFFSLVTILLQQPNLWTRNQFKVGELSCAEGGISCCWRGMRGWAGRRRSGWGREREAPPLATWTPTHLPLPVIHTNFLILLLTANKIKSTYVSSSVAEPELKLNCLLRPKPEPK